MGWIILIVLAGLVGFAVYLQKRAKALVNEIASLQEKLASQAALLNTHTETISSVKEILGSQKELLASYKERLAGLSPHLAPQLQPAAVEAAPAAPNDELDEKSRKSMGEEKARFQKEVQEKRKNMDWYEKEFSIALDALLELLLLIPRSKQKAIIAKMPASVIKKGFQRLSDSL